MPVARKSLFTACAALLITPVSAPAQSFTWWDVFTPDRLVENALQYGVLALRTQIDLTYADLTVNMLAGRATVTDVKLWPLPEWDQSGDCEILVDRLVLAQAPLDQSGRIRLKVSGFGISAPAICLPPDVRPALLATGSQSISVPFFGFDLDYHVASAGAQIQANFVVEKLVAVDLNADFSYFWFDGRDDMENPDPVFELSSASISVENNGGWEVAKAMLPPSFTNPDTATRAIGAILKDALLGMNREALSGAQGGTQNGADIGLNASQTAFIASATRSWSSFLADPRRLVLETGYAPDETAYLDFPAYEEDPRLLFDDLAPQLSLAPASARAAIPVDLVRAALGDKAGDLSADDRLRVGTALVSGIGAPRNIPAGSALLAELARSGNSAAAAALAETLETRLPETAYVWALRAGAAGVDGATARLDRLESVLDMTVILQIQGEASQNAVHPVEALASIGAIKQQARARLTGKGQTRSYGIAAMWAMLAAATGDAESSDMLEEIDARVRSGDSASDAAWAKVEAASSGLAMKIWLSRDLPAAFGINR
ncbi:MAG: hypothetical protein COC12_03900 [Rhodobacteraceae bacterium]|nr:MAG: hypothetical protein COC12_03900 [Paracoccaceae bacterium]